MVDELDVKNSCVSCSYIDCINLYRCRKYGDRQIGGELYLYSQFDNTKIYKEKLYNHVCLNGSLLKCACSIVFTLNELFPKDYLVIIGNEIVRDMKASFFLAMSGHYRQAILLQRCVFENFLYGLFFSTDYEGAIKSDEEKKNIDEQFYKWLNGDYEFRKPGKIRTIKNDLQKNYLISEEENSEWKKLNNELCHFVHTIQKTSTGMDLIKCGDVEMKSCYSDVEFDEKSLKEWSKYYQRTFFLILNKLIKLFPSIKKEETGKKAFDILDEQFKKRRGELENKYLDEILDSIQ